MVDNGQVYMRQLYIMSRWVKRLEPFPMADLHIHLFADNASPMIGMDVNGPTAVVNSLACCDEMLPQSGMLLNQRFDPAIASGEKRIGHY